MASSEGYIKEKLMYYKFLETFVLSVLFNKGERQVLSKEFNPVKFLFLTFLFANLLFSGFMVIRLSKLYNSIKYNCPEVVEDYDLLNHVPLDKRLIEYHEALDESTKHDIIAHSLLYNEKHTSLGFKVK